MIFERNLVKEILGELYMPNGKLTQLKFYSMIAIAISQMNNRLTLYYYIETQLDRACCLKNKVRDISRAGRLI